MNTLGQYCKIIGMNCNVCKFYTFCRTSAKAAPPLLFLFVRDVAS
jgi:hypothetical protein